VAKTLGEILRQARLEAGLSMRDLERLTGMSSAALSQIETGTRRDPGFRTVLQIARGIRISMEELALRLEGRGTAATSRGSGRALAAALTEIDKARGDSLRAAERLERAIAALGTSKKKSSRKRS